MRMRFGKWKLKRKKINYTNMIKIILNILLRYHRKADTSTHSLLGNGNSQNPKTQSQHHNQLKAWCHTKTEIMASIWKGVPTKMLRNLKHLNISKLNKNNKKCSSMKPKAVTNGLVYQFSPNHPEGVYYTKHTIFPLGIHCWKISVCTCVKVESEWLFRVTYRVIEGNWSGRFERNWSYALC